MSKLIDWESVLPKLDTMALVNTYAGIISGITEKYTWYSNEDTVTKIAWRYQMASSTVKYAIGKLVEKKLIKHKTRGVYVVDKKYLR